MVKEDVIKFSVIAVLIVIPLLLCVLVIMAISDIFYGTNKLGIRRKPNIQYNTGNVIVFLSQFTFYLVC